MLDSQELNITSFKEKNLQIKGMGICQKAMKTEKQNIVIIIKIIIFRRKGKKYSLS